MPDIAQIILSGVANPWLYLPLAVLLGALHALEPGHSKSIMAAFIIAIRGTSMQAVVLGIAAAVGHTMVVWALVIAALWLGNDLIEKQAYPWLVLLSGLMIIAIAVRLFFVMSHHGHHDHDHDHDHAHDHDHDHAHHHDEHDHHGHTHASPEEIAAKYAGRNVSYGEIIWFGFTGGLLPCPSAIAVLLVALKMKAFALGTAMVAAFSVGLAATLISVGLVAAWGTKQLSGWSGFDRWTSILPRVSVGIVLALGLAVTVHGILLIKG